MEHATVGVHAVETLRFAKGGHAAPAPVAGDTIGRNVSWTPDVGPEGREHTTEQGVVTSAPVVLVH